MRKISRGLLVLGILLLLPRVALPQESYPVLHMRRGNVDAQVLIEQLAPEGTDIDAVLRGKQTIKGYGEDIDGQYAHRDVYILEDMTVFIQEPSGEIHVEWDSPVKAEYDAIEREQREKHDPDYDYMLDDGQTPFYGQTTREDVPSSDESERINDFAQEFANQLGIELLLDPVLFKISLYTYPDGQTLEKGYARYAVLRNNLPVETVAYWSEISAMGYYVEAEALSIEWYENEVVAANLTLYTCESEEVVSDGLISLDEAREAVDSELKRRIANEGREPIADLCYMPTPEFKGQLYAVFVPAWRFRFRGEDGNTHRVNALTGQVIR